MELLNATKMKAAYTMGLKPDGRELLVVVVKGTFKLPATGEVAELAPEQADLVMADTFTGEPGFSAPVYESDFPPAKPRCDVILNGSAYAPGGREATRVQVGLRVGQMIKSFDVVGRRAWKKGLFGVSATSPEPFVRMAISYDVAFGGVDKTHANEKKHKACVENPVGHGFHSNLTKEAVQGTPLPNTEETGRPVKRPNGKYRPMSFGTIGRGWQPRPKFAGTYDQNWVDNVFPFLPKDFDERYYQCAPEDQQVDHLRGGEEVVLVNLTPAGRAVVKLPTVEVPVAFYRKDYSEHETRAVADTVIIEPDRNRVMIVWRAALPLKKNIFEIAQVVVGRMPRSWYRARELGKTWYPSLKEFVDEKRAAQMEAEASETIASDSAD